MRRYTKTVRKRVVKNKPCMFCVQKTEPDYKETEILKRFLSERGKIIARAGTGICQKHQRRLTRAIKRARFLALLPFIVRPA